MERTPSQAFRRIHHNSGACSIDLLYIKPMVNGPFWSELRAGIQRLECTFITAEKCDWRAFYLCTYRTGCPSYIRSSSLDFCIGDRACHLFMMLTKTTHPPAGADPIVVIQGAYAWSYLLFPVFIGSAIIVIIALVINNLRKNRQYPSFWL